jgi:hypothetical protein
MSGQRPSSPETQNEDLEPGSPPRHATHPKGSEQSMKTDKTKTDPATGKPNN